MNEGAPRFRISNAYKFMASLLALAIAAPVSAQTAPQSSDQPDSDQPDNSTIIIVTAQKREQLLIDVPQAMSVIDEETVDRLGITGLNDISGLSPNFNFDANSARDERLIIRGVSSDTRFVGSESAVGVVLDGVFQSGVSALNLDVAEIERVEILRGPQGTLFGRNTTAGLVNIVTRRPGNEFRGRGILEYGNYDHMLLNSSVSGPIVADRLFVGISALYENRDGFQRTQLGDDAWNQDLFAVRGDIVWQPSEGWDVRFLADYQTEDHSFGQPDYTPEDYVLEHAFFPNNMDREIFSGSVNISRTFDSGSEIRFIAAYKDYSIDELIDADFMSLPFELFTNLSRERGEEQSFELQYFSPSGGSVEWLIGTYVQFQSNQINGLYDADYDTGFDIIFRPLFGFPPGFTLRDFVTANGQANQCNRPAPACLQSRADVLWNFDTSTAALFGNVSIDLTDRLNTQLGARISYEKKEFNYSSTGSFYGVPGVVNTIVSPFFVEDESDDFYFTPRIALSYNISDMINIYASAAQGYKSGNFYGNILGMSDVDGNGQNDFTERLQVGPETSWTFELGMKGAIPGLRYDLTGYYIVYDGLQTQGLLENQNPALAPFNYLANADFENYGIEGEVHADLSSAFSVSLGAAYNWGSFTNYDNCAAFSGAVLNCTGNRPVYAPHLTGFGRLNWNVPVTDNGWEIVGYSQARYRGSRFFTVTNDLEDDGYWLVDGLLGLESPEGQFQVAFWVNNLFDEEYFTLRASAGADILSLIGEPRTYGLRVTTRF